MANEHTDKKMNIELENPADFTSPEELYQKLRSEEHTSELQSH